MISIVYILIWETYAYREKLPSFPYSVDSVETHLSGQVRW